MQQILQDLGSGTTTVVEAPTPQVRSGTLLIDATVSLVSTGTERMLVEFGRASLVKKASQQPDKVRQVLQKVQTDGLMTTVDAVRSKLGQPIPLGYCHVGRVREVGSGVTGFRPGDRVISNGPHADVVCIPKNLCARIPDAVSDEAAAFVVVASIGLQGIRLAQPTLGESFVVTGVGLIGLLTVQLLRAHGARVLAVDFDPAKLALAHGFGAETCNPAAGEDPVAAAMAFSRGLGVDGVIITASTKSSEPVSQAAHMCRKRGRIVLVGVTGLELSRADFYEKELTFQVSCSYGPGRYDAAYEEGGQDYPVAHVRWTEKRNFEAVLDLMASGSLNVEPLISHRFAFENAPVAYETVTADKSALGILLTYDHDVEARHVSVVSLNPDSRKTPAGRAVMGFIGAGNYASRMLIPAFRAGGAVLHSIASSGGINGVVHGSRAGFGKACASASDIIGDPDVNAIAIVTRHNSHACFASAALKSGKHVFVEKPLGLTHEELAEVEAAHAASDALLMVGFNRRFAPQIIKMKSLLNSVREPKSFVMLMNAGAIPADHWTQDKAVGGGRIIGEACHYIDLMRHLAGSEVVSVQARRMGDNDATPITEDKAAIMLGFADGSFGVIHYLANGAASFPKERIEVFAAGRTLQLDNFLKLKGFGWPAFKKNSLFRQDKGQTACAAAFLRAVETGGPPPIPAAELFEVARVTLEATDQLRSQS